MVDSIFGGELQDLQQVTTPPFRKWFCTSKQWWLGNSGTRKVSHPESMKMKHFPGAAAIRAKGSPEARIKVFFSWLSSSLKQLIQLSSIKNLTAIKCFSPRCDALRNCVECKVFHQYWNTDFDSAMKCLAVIMDTIHWIAWQKRGNIMNHLFRNANDGNSSTNHQKGSQCAQCR